MRRFALVLLAIPTLTVAAGSSGREPSVAEGELPADLAVRLAERAQDYEDATLGFQCTETTYEERGGRGDPKEKVTPRRYLLERAEGGAVFQALRGKGGGDVSAGSPFRFPEPFAWTQIFDPNLSGLFRFVVGEEGDLDGRPALPIRFEASAPPQDGRRIVEWSGTAWVDPAGGDLIRIEAEPNFQPERLRSAYVRAAGSTGFAVGNVRLGHGAAPSGREIVVDFRQSHGDLWYPSQVAEREFVMPTVHSKVTDERRLVVYSDYRFFTTETKQRAGNGD